MLAVWDARVAAIAADEDAALAAQQADIEAEVDAEVESFAAAARARTPIDLLQLHKLSLSAARGGSAGVSRCAGALAQLPTALTIAAA